MSKGIRPRDADRRPRRRLALGSSLAPPPQGPAQPEGAAQPDSTFLVPTCLPPSVATPKLGNSPVPHHRFRGALALPPAITAQLDHLTLRNFGQEPVSARVFDTPSSATRPGPRSGDSSNASSRERYQASRVYFWP